MQLSDMHCVKSIRIRSFFGLYFPTFELNTNKYSAPLCIKSKRGKIRVRKIPNKSTFQASIFFLFYFFYLSFLSRTLLNHRTAGEGGRHFFNSSLPLPPASQILTHQPGITAESSPLHIANSRTRTANFWFPSASREPLSTK